MTVPHGPGSNRRNMAGLRKIFIFLAFSLLAPHLAAQEVNYSWELPVVPVKISWSASQGIRVSVGHAVKTPLGTFGIEYTRALSRSREESPCVTVSGTRVGTQDLLVVLRDRSKSTGEDTIYKIENGRNLEVDADGRTNIRIGGGMVIIDVTDATDLHVTLRPDESTSTRKVAYILSKYYRNLATNNHEQAGRAYAGRVERYYNLTDISRDAVIAQLRKYDGMFNVYGKHFDIRWETLEVTDTPDGHIVTYLIDYSIDRYDKTLPTHYRISMFIRMNSRYEITSIYEKILSKE